MKIVLIGPFPPYRGGISMFNHSLAKELEKNNQVYRISFSLQYPNLLFPGKSQFFDFNGDPSKKLINSINPFSWSSTASYINNINPDLVIFQYWMPFFAPSFGTIIKKVKRNLNTKALVICDNIIPHEDRPFDKLLTKYFFNNIDYFIVMSRSVEADLLSLYPGADYLYTPHPLYDIFGASIQKDKAKISQDPRGVALELDGEICFGSGSVILKDDLKQGSWFFFGDFDFQNLWSKKKTEELSKTNPKIYLNDLKDHYHYLTYNVRNAQQIAVHSPFLAGVTDKKLPSRPFVIKIEGSIKHYFEKGQKSKVNRLEKIIEDLYNQNIDGSDIVILSSNRITNPKNILGFSNIAKFYKTVDLTQIKTFGKEIIKPEDKNSIYFSTTHAFQGMESKIVILLDPLTSPTEDRHENIAEYTYGREPKNLITYNAMGRANTLLYVIWDKIHEKYTNQQIGKALKIQDEISK